MWMFDLNGMYGRNLSLFLLEEIASCTAELLYDITFNFD